MPVMSMDGGSTPHTLIGVWLAGVAILAPRLDAHSSPVLHHEVQRDIDEANPNRADGEEDQEFSTAHAEVRGHSDRPAAVCIRREWAHAQS